MKKGLRKNVLVIGLALSLVLAGTACSKKLTDGTSAPDASAVSTPDPMSYEAIDAKISDYNLELNKYMKDHLAECTSKSTSGSTYGGYPANCIYTISPDSTYESLQMEKTITNGVQADEYFNLGDALFIARTTIYNDGNFDPVTKYYITDGVLYQVDGENQTVTKIVDLNAPEAAQKKTELDIYFTFDEIRALYA